MLQKLYDSEINFVIATDWHDGFRVGIGGHTMELCVFKTTKKTFRECEVWLDTMARREWPKSDYAKFA